MTEYRYGGFWRRGLAMAIDAFILYFLFIVLILAEFAVLPSHPYVHHPEASSDLGEYMPGGMLLGHIIIFVIMGALYFTYFHGSIGQTPGKILLRLKVIRSRDRDLTYGIAFLRWVSYAISSMFLYLGFLWAAFDCRKQTWHDKIAGTLVVLVDDEDDQGPQQLTMDL